MPLRKAAFIVVFLAIVAFGANRLIQAHRYHVPIHADEVQQIKLLRAETAQPEYRAVPASDIPSIVRWFNGASFQGDNDSLAGPGCKAVDMFIYLRAGDSIGVTIVGDRMEVSQNGRYYFLKHQHLEEYIRIGRTQGSGC